MLNTIGSNCNTLFMKYDKTILLLLLLLLLYDKTNYLAEVEVEHI